MKPYLKLYSVNGNERNNDYLKVKDCVHFTQMNIMHSIDTFDFLELKDTNLRSDLFQIYCKVRLLRDKYEVDDEN